MSKMENARIAEMLLDDLNQRNLGAERDIYAEDYMSMGPGALQPMDRETAIQYIQVFLDAFPDLHFDRLATVADDDRVVLIWRATGTHQGALGLPTGDTLQPTGRQVVTDGNTVYEFRDGKIASSQSYWDMGRLMQELGAIKVPERKP